jgi:outer membrane receptor for ferrienterochelin and colicin
MLNRFTISLTQIILVVLLLCSNFIYAANGTLKGKIRNGQTDDPLPYSNVLLLGTSFGAAADKEGDYIIRNIPPGNYTLRATYIGFKQQEIEIQIIDGKITEHNITLSPEILEGETVVVTAQAEGQLGAINEQLASIEIKNVVSMSKIRELPDANAAESVSRLPGVSLIRTGGEGSRVVIRGLSPQYNRVTIDGVELPGNVISNDPNDHKSQYSSSDELTILGDRSTDLSMISSNSLDGIEVVKAITPDMDATVFGGTVNFSMHKANKRLFDKPNFEIQLQGSHNNLKNSFRNYKTAGSYEQRFFDNSLGVFLQGSAEERNLSANQLKANYNFAGKLYITDEGNPEFQSMNLTDVFRERKRYNATLVLDYNYENGNISLFNFVSRSKTRTISRDEAYLLLDDDVYYSAINSNTILDVYSNLLSFKQNLFGFNIEARLSHSYSVTDNPEDVKFNFWQNGAGLTGLLSALKYKSAKEIAATVVRRPEDAAFFDIYNVGSISKDRTLNAGLDVSTDVAFSNFLSSKFKIGGAYQYRDRSFDYNQYSGSVFYDDGGQVSAAVLRAFPQFGTSITASDFNDPGYDYGTFLKGDYTLVNPLDVELMLKVIEVAKKNPGTGNGGGYKVNKASTILDDYSGNETRSAAYTMANVNVGQTITIVPGVRYQNLITDYTGIRGEAVPGGIQYVKAEETVSHGYWLPMLHFRYKPLDWFQFHFAYTNTLNYPDYNTIIPKYYIGTNFVLYNNYRLKPATSENFDVVCSFFNNEIGLFSISGFKKRIKDLIFTSKTYPKDFSAYPELYEKLKNRTESYTLFTYINNSIPIDVLGMETEWQTNFWYFPEPFNGIVLNINYTHIFSEAKYPKTYLISYLDTITYIQKTKSVDTSYTTRLLNQPNDIVNISLGYDYADFSFRVSMLYQDNIFRKPDFWYQNRGHSDKYVRFDFSVKQILPWFGLQVYFNLNNITGEDDIDINQKTSFITSQERYGMTADLGIRMNL